MAHQKLYNIHAGAAHGAPMRSTYKTKEAKEGGLQLRHGGDELLVRATSILTTKVVLYRVVSHRAK